ncbi:MAG TPA: 30S ribosomal protein S12 methylthiotransferase RimO [Thermodesulfobacteriota bacterium]|nr:30S ribosomal protein S12 methylthiotransferase RimO [Thermodesulfobacteriota bacterium]
MSRSVYYVSLGCPKNFVDTEVMLGSLLEAGYRPVADPAEAEVLVVNTCAFIREAKEESIETILELAAYKTPGRGRARTLVVTGCLPQRYERQLKAELPEVDLFLGTGDYPKLAALLEQPRAVQRAFTVGPAGYLPEADDPRPTALGRASAYLKIAEGCDHTCAFCAIPAMRGRLVSRPIESVVAEAARLAEAGTRELVLVSQDTTAYGCDRRDGTSLPALVRRLAALRGIEWIRLMYAYPAEVTDELIELLAQEPKLCGYLDMPIQHVADGVLRRMRRKGDGAAIRRLVERLRARVPHLALRTTVLVGFPGETDRDFAELLAFVEEGHFDYLGVFRFSREDGTAADAMDGQVPERVKRQRRSAVLQAQARVAAARNRARIGSRQPVLVEAAGAGRRPARGRTAQQAPEIDGCVYLTGRPVPAGTLAEARITDSRGYDLVAELI